MPGPTTYFDPGHADSLEPAQRSLVERRARVLGSAYRLFYTHPIELVRGSGTKVWDAGGREYLDAYNNVPSVGHAHPRVVEAMARQAGTLNTHTRYLSDGVVTYAEQLLATVPAPLGNVMFACTGSEANDLAIRMTKYASGGTGVLVTDNAYHGITSEIAAISPSLGGAASLADWVAVVPAPHPGVDFGAAVRDGLRRLDEAGIAVAALIVDTIFSSDGVLVDVRGLADAVAAVRARGGYFVADEVQPGFGRLGTGMWGFERLGVAPDLMTIGKPMGNGQPIAAVVARPDLVDEFNRRSRYFNTFGGSTVSIAAAQATLDVLRDEHLVENARLVGGRLLRELATIDGVASVRGSGLFIGVDVADQSVATRTVNRMRDGGVLLAASGAGNTTIKIRPPLPFSDGDADRLLTELSKALS